jgi:L-ascorbate metabolism protein UlaG (beta-lactamase superfamily)
MGVSVKWLGHASFQIKVNHRSIYIDPYQGTYEDKADVILVTHSHHDHCDTAKIKSVRKDETVVIAPADCRSRIGGEVKSLKPGERLTVGSIKVEAVPAYNYKRFREPGVPFHPKGLGVGYVMKVDGKTIYHAGDTDFIREMRGLKDISLALLPSGGKYTMDSSEAVEAALSIKPEVVIPMHRLDTEPREFKKQVEMSSKIKVVLLRPGEEYELEPAQTL